MYAFGGRPGPLLIVVWLLAAFGQAGYGAAPDAQVIVMCIEGQPDEVTVAYAQRVRESDARKDLEAILRLGEWELDGLPTYRGPSQESPTATISARVRGMVQRMSGELPVAPFVVALRRLRRISVTFLVEDPFYYKGISAPVENRYVRVEPLVVPTRTSYTFDVTVKDSAMEDVSSVPDLGSDAANRGGARGRSATAYGILTALALSLSLGAYVAVRLVVRRRTASAE